MNNTLRLLTAMALSCTFSLANADVVQVWNCKLQEGKTNDDLQAASSVWLAAAKKLPGNEKLEAWHNFPVSSGSS